MLACEMRRTDSRPGTVPSESTGSGQPCALCLAQQSNPGLALAPLRFQSPWGSPSHPSFLLPSLVPLPRAFYLSF